MIPRTPRLAIWAAPWLLAAIASAQSPGHDGPVVAEGKTGPARFVAPLLEVFDEERAWDCVAFADRYFRTPGNLGYNATLDHFARILREAGYGEKSGFELRTIRTPLKTPAWNPRSASLEVLLPDAPPRVLHAFEDENGVDRVMLPVNAPEADVQGPLAFTLEDVRPGSVLVTESRLHRRLLRSAEEAGAVLVLSSALFEFTVDPGGGDEHLDAVLYASVPSGTTLPVAQISPRSHRVLAQLASRHEELRVSFRAKVEWNEGPLRTLVAVIVGTSRPEEAVAIAAHVQEPGAGDNASGAGGMVEAARSFAGAVAEGALARPARSLVLLWGDEMRASAIWLDESSREAVAGISADMLGQSRERTGAICLLERGPDPGSLDVLPPDRHTPWGAGRVDEEDLIESGISLVARLALADVGRACGGWSTGEHPFEGGSDHAVFQRRGIPGLLFWHFTDFTYHTGLDRLDRLDREELRRSSVAVTATALAIADLRADDLDRYFRSNELEERLRVDAAREADRPDVAERWRSWCDCVEAWLRRRCVDLEKN